MKKILDIIEKILKYLSIVCLISLIGVVLLQVITRMFFPKAPSWTEELSRMLYVHIIGFAAPIALRNDQFVLVDIVVNLLPKKLKTIQSVVSRFSVFVICLIFAYTSYGFMLIGLRETSIALVWPMIIPFSSMFFCGLFMLIYSIEKVSNDLIGIIKGR